MSDDSEGLREELQRATSPRYQVGEEIGRGGMAIVFRGLDAADGRAVAFKVLKRQYAMVLGPSRFLREIRLLSELHHPNILPLLDSGQSGTLFYFVMPLVDGETLQARLEREPQLPLDVVQRIVTQVASALDHAHAADVVHRDIKPSNLFLSGDQTMLADFGIAKDLTPTDEESTTSTGLVVGTAQYMSPEQAGGSVRPDRRSDVYSLGCVAYQMLVGEPPFNGPSVQAVIARHRSVPAPAVRLLRPELPAGVDVVIRKALAKSPADRYQSAGEFARALSDPAQLRAAAKAAEEPGRVHRWLRPLVIGLACVVVGVWYVAHRRDAIRDANGGSALPDTTRYAILSFSQDTDVPSALPSALLLQDAMAKWGGISSVDPFQVRDIVSRRDTAGFNDADWRRMATSLGAGRYIRGSASLLGDSIRVHAVLYDALTRVADPAIREQTVRIPLDLTGADSAFAVLADGLLLRHDGTGGRQPAGVTTSLPARQAFEQGSAAINDWNLAKADSSFSEAARNDPEYAQAHLWLALVRSWSDPETPADWRSAADRAAAGRARLSTRDRQISDAVLALSRGDVAAACGTWNKLTVEDPSDFVVWYGLASCLQQDHAVVRDPTSPTRWRFRSSYSRALYSYQRAYGLLPSILRAFRRASFSDLVDLLLASGTNLRAGRALPPDSVAFLAAPSWAGDSLVLYPVPLEAVARGAGIFTSTTGEAVHHQRERVYEIARSWVADFPASADALQALAVSLEVLGDRSALDTIARARGLAVGPAETIRVVTAEIWMRVLFGAPSTLADLRSARRMADSILGSLPPANPAEPMLLSSLAALTGRAHLAAELGRQIPARDRLDTPPSLAGVGITFLTYAAMGGPVDSLRLLEPQVSRAIAKEVLAEDRMQVQQTWLALPVILGFPAYHFPAVAQLAGPSASPLNADAAFVRGDTAAAWRELGRLRPVDPNGAPAAQTIDMGYAIAWLMGELGRPDSAIAFLDPSLTTLARTPPQLFLDVYQAGALVRAMALRAELADRMGDRAAARQWALAVVTLWSGADDFLQPLVKRMQAMAQ